MKEAITINEFIEMLNDYKLYYHGNSYQETLNYCFIDNLNRLKRETREGHPKRETINEILYCISILTPEFIPNLKKQGLKQILYK